MKNQIADYPFPPTTHTLREISASLPNSGWYKKVEEKPLSDLDKAIIQAIPYWPHVISLAQLRARFKLNDAALKGRIVSLQFIGKIFDDDETHSLSRLKGGFI